MLAILQEEGDISNVDLAERVGMSPSPCLRKVKSLRDAGFIRKFAALLDRKKLGFEIIAIVEVKVPQVANQEIVKEFQEAVRREAAIVECYITSGQFDFLLKVVARTMDDYSNFVTRKLLRMPGVHDTRSTFVMDIIKHSTALPI
jgi:Lrp/AsnC family leucine-responsive transcriptional regulator